VHEAPEFIDLAMNEKLEDIIRDVGAKSFAKVVFENISNDVETLLYLD